MREEVTFVVTVTSKMWSESIANYVSLESLLESLFFHIKNELVMQGDRTTPVQTGLKENAAYHCHANEILLVYLLVKIDLLFTNNNFLLNFCENR